MNATQVTADIMEEFLEGAFHTILYVRSLYPAGIFERRNKYNVPLQMCCHPEVNRYIHELLQSIKSLLVKDVVSQVALVINGPQHVPIERFVFEFEAAKSADLRGDAFLTRLEQALRAFLLKINISDSLLQTLPPDCSWTVQVHTREASMMDLQQKQLIQEFAWVEAEKHEVTMNSSKLTPLKAVDTGLLKMQLYVEESVEQR